MQSGCDSWDTCSRVKYPLSLEAGEEVSEVEVGSSRTTEGGIREDLREGTNEDRRPVNGDTVGDLDEQRDLVSYPC